MCDVMCGRGGDNDACTGVHAMTTTGPHMWYDINFCPPPGIGDVFIMGF